MEGDPDLQLTLLHPWQKLICTSYCPMPEYVIANARWGLSSRRRLLSRFCLTLSESHTCGEMEESKHKSKTKALKMLCFSVSTVLVIWKCQRLVTQGQAGHHSTGELSALLPELSAFISASVPFIGSLLRAAQHRSCTGNGWMGSAISR